MPPTLSFCTYATYSWLPWLKFLKVEKLIVNESDFFNDYNRVSCLGLNRFNLLPPVFANGESLPTERLECKTLMTVAKAGYYVPESYISIATPSSLRNHVRKIVFDVQSFGRDKLTRLLDSSLSNDKKLDWLIRVAEYIWTPPEDINN